MNFASVWYSVSDESEVATPHLYVSPAYAIFADLRNHSSYFKAFIDVAPVRRVPRRKAAASSKADLEMHSESEIDRAFEQRLQRMQKSGVFGDNLEIQAFAREFGVDVKIYQREHAYVICDDNGSGNAGRASGEDRKVVHIAYHVSLFNL